MNINICAVCERDELDNTNSMIMAVEGRQRRVCFSCMDKISTMRGCYDRFVQCGSSFANFDTKQENIAGMGSVFNLGGSQIARDILRPVQIKNRLDEYIIGQDKAKKTIAVAMYNHYKRVAFPDDSIKKSNILLVGPTGSGKTYLVETLAKIMNMPVALCTATTLTEAGYIGEDVESVVARLFDVCEHDIERTQKGIIFIDEIDKLCASSSDTEKKVGGKGVQQALLRLLEGTVVSIKTGDSSLMRESKVDIDTKNILFICGGAFPAVEEIISRRLNKNIGSNMGFAVTSKTLETEAVTSNLLLHVTTDDLCEFGMIPEIIGRLPVIAPLEELSVDALIKILSVPKGCLLKQYQRLFELDGIRLLMEDDAMRCVAERAIDLGTGARSLRAIMETVLEELMFELPGRDVEELIITRDYVEDKSAPLIKERLYAGIAGA